ncbi:MAG: hypothetical protein CMC82_05990 [Flavobacteriaceae bacterium]|nr:hypothetical protein [Flavobacteriaceae bacterium]
MKYLLFDNPYRDYGASFDIVLVGSRKRGFGAYSEKDAELLQQIHNGAGIKEISLPQYETLKKKLTKPAVSSKSLRMVQQDPSKDPHAVYAEKEDTEVPSKTAKELVNIESSEIESPM